MFCFWLTTGFAGNERKLQHKFIIIANLESLSATAQRKTWRSPQERGLNRFWRAENISVAMLSRSLWSSRREREISSGIRQRRPVRDALAGPLRQRARSGLEVTRNPSELWNAKNASQISHIYFPFIEGKRESERGRARNHLSAKVAL